MSDGKKISRTDELTAILAEQFQDQLAKLVEGVDDRIAYRLSPIETKLDKLGKDMKTVKLAIKNTNQDIKSLDKAMGYTEHKVHLIKHLITDHYIGSARDDRKKLDELDERLTHLEKTT